MRKLLFIGMVVLFATGKSYAQGLDLADAFGLDSARIEGMWDTWSIRAITTLKASRFAIISGKSSVSYSPNNPLSAGAGITYKFISLDVAFNIPGSEPNPTKRFDAVVSFGLKRHYASIGYQRFKGFEPNDNLNNEYAFRPDVRTQVFEMLYRFSWPRRGLSLKALLAGLQVQDKSTGVFIFGGYGMWDQVKADSSLIPPERIDDFPSRAKANFASQYSLGTTAGYAYSLVLPYNTFILVRYPPG